MTEGRALLRGLIWPNVGLCANESSGGRVRICQKSARTTRVEAMRVAITFCRGAFVEQLASSLADWHCPSDLVPLDESAPGEDGESAGT
jgi:hypothetical protein